MIAVVVCNYNQPAETDALVEFLLDRQTLRLQFVVVDNGSDKTNPSQYTTLCLPTNQRKAGGLLAGFEAAKKLRPEVYWFLSTSWTFEPFDRDPAADLAATLYSIDNAVSICPGFTGEVNGKPHKEGAARDGSHWHLTKLPGPYAMFRAGWIEQAGLIDPALTNAWGAEFELHRRALDEGKVALVSDDVRVRVKECDVYKKGLAECSFDEYCRRATAEMWSVLGAKYGPNWPQILDVAEFL